MLTETLKKDHILSNTLVIAFTELLFMLGGLKLMRMIVRAASSAIDSGSDTYSEFMINMIFLASFIIPILFCVLYMRIGRGFKPLPFYSGDLGDFSKLGLFRHLSQTGLSIGLNWYLVPDEGHNNDGMYTGYLDDPSFDCCDPDLRKALYPIAHGNRCIVALETTLDARYYSALLDFRGMSKADRQVYTILICRISQSGP